jgi:hypothetical protein
VQCSVLNREQKVQIIQKKVSNQDAGVWCAALMIERTVLVCSSQYREEAALIHDLDFLTAIQPIVYY